MDGTLNSVGPDDFDFPWSTAEHGAAFRAIPDRLYLDRDHRSSFRLITHLPLSVRKREILRIMQKHGADAGSIKLAIRRARGSYLRQCMYRLRLDRWISVRLGIASSLSWRETHQ